MHLSPIATKPYIFVRGILKGIELLCYAENKNKRNNNLFGAE